MKALAPFALSVFALSCALPAMAAGSAQSTINGFAVTLFDLSPNDGIAPAISFSADPNGNTSFVSASTSDYYYHVQSSYTFGQVVFGPEDATAVSGETQSRGSISGNFAIGDLTVQASGTARPSLRVPGGAGGRFDSLASIGDLFTPGGLSFSLTPYTMAVFGAYANLFAQTTIELDGSLFLSEGAHADVSLAVQGDGHESSDGRAIDAGISKTMYDPIAQRFVYTGEAKSLLDQYLSAGFSNFTASAVDGSVLLRSSASGYRVASIPEPGVWALMLMGLAGLTCRRAVQRWRAG